MPTGMAQTVARGPLVVVEDGRWTVKGVVSYGVGCAKPGYAGMYTRVTHYLTGSRRALQLRIDMYNVLSI